MSDFTGEDFDFAVGTIKGLRSWSIDDKGRLRGVTHPAIWKPGENVAKCAQGAGRYTPCPSPYGIYGCGDSTCVPYKGHFLATEPHDFDPECQCGFWAYDEVGFEEHADAVGVIEGYGRTTIGTKGFRCEKARIVALCRNTEKGTLSLSEWLRLKELYPDAEFFDEFDDMVLAHGQVLRSWPTVDEDFWTEEPEPTGAWSAYLSANVTSYQTAMAHVQAQLNAMSARSGPQSFVSTPRPGFISTPRRLGKRNPFLFGGGGS